MVLHCTFIESGCIALHCIESGLAWAHRNTRSKNVFWMHAVPNIFHRPNSQIGKGIGIEWYKFHCMALHCIALCCNAMNWNWPLATPRWPVTQCVFYCMWFQIFPKLTLALTWYDIKFHCIVLEGIAWNYTALRWIGIGVAATPRCPVTQLFRTLHVVQNIFF